MQISNLDSYSALQAQAETASLPTDPQSGGGTSFQDILANAAGQSGSATPFGAQTASGSQDSAQLAALNFSDLNPTQLFALDQDSSGASNSLSSSPFTTSGAFGSSSSHNSTSTTLNPATADNSGSTSFSNLQKSLLESSATTNAANYDPTLSVDIANLAL